MKSGKVEITGWRTGFRKVEMDKLLQRDCRMGLRDAKQCVDAILEGESIVVEVCHSDEFVREATNLGAECAIFRHTVR